MGQRKQIKTLYFRKNPLLKFPIFYIGFKGDFLTLTRSLYMVEMKNLGNQILAELKPNYKQCINCGKMIRIKGNKTMYCEDCAEKMLKNSWKTASEKYRNNQKS